MAILEEPALAGVEIGSSEWFAIQSQIIASRPLVKDAYDAWYGAMLADVATAPDDGDKRVLEIGSGSGYVKTLDPTVITSDIMEGHADMVVDAQALPFGDSSLRGILLTHVFHHIPDVRLFLNEAVRTLIPGGVIAMIDVAHTPLSRLFFGNFHPEAYEHRASEWRLNTSGTYGGANQALSWIVFRRDYKIFASQFPQLRLECVEYLPWFGYLLSGGATRRDLIPKNAVGVVRLLDSASRIMNGACALHWHLRIRKVSA